MSQKSLNDEKLYRKKYRKLLHFDINILNILNIFTDIIGMAPPINVQDWYGDRHTCQIASGALEYRHLDRRHGVHAEGGGMMGQVTLNDRGLYRLKL